MPEIYLPEGELREEFTRRRRRQWLVVVPVIAAMLAFHWIDEIPDTALGGLSQTILLLAALGTVLAALAFSLYNWRCPACSKYLGRTINPKHCGNCGFRLQA
jgi:hypothetical protein